MQEICAVMEKAATLVADAQRARAMDAVMNQMKLTVLPLFAQLANAPVWTMLSQVVQDAAVQMVEEEAFGPCEAAKPARHVLQALETIERGGAELRRWSGDERFQLKAPQPSKTFINWLLPQPQQHISVPVAEIVEQLAYLMGLLSMAGQEAHLASQTIMHVRDPRLRVVSEHTHTNLPQIEPQEFFIPLPTGHYVSARDKGSDLLECLDQCGQFLNHAAQRGRERIRSASIDDKAFSPGVVAAEAMAVMNIVKNGLSTCNALAIVAIQYIGDSVVAR
ncbi:MAG: hypothetical protein ACXVA4_03255 [Ktedonobacterales bacterium]